MIKLLLQSKTYANNFFGMETQNMIITIPASDRFMAAARLMFYATYWNNVKNK
jgi:hypothetical protein